MNEYCWNPCTQEWGTWETGPAISITLSAGTQALGAGNGAAWRVIISAVPNALTADPETVVQIASGNQSAGTNGIGAVSIQNPTLVMRYEDFGDIIRGPLFAFGLATTLIVTRRDVRWRPKGS